MINRNLITVLVTTIALFGSSIAGAMLFNLSPQFYLGGEVNYYKLNLNERFRDSDEKNGVKFNNKKAGFTVLGGSRLTNLLGVELGYSFFKRIDGEQNSYKGVIKSKNVYIDALGFIPLTLLPGCEAIISAGLGHYSVDHKLTDAAKNVVANYSGKKSKTGLRLGTGLQLGFSDLVSLRAMVRYQRGIKDSVKSLMSVAVGFSVKLL